MQLTVGGIYFYKELGYLRILSKKDKDLFVCSVRKTNETIELHKDQLRNRITIVVMQKAF